MARLERSHIHTLNLNPEELRLILKALGGRLKQEEAEAAKLLGDELSKQKALEGQHQWKETKKLMVNLLDAGILPVGCQDFEYTPKHT